MKRPITGLDRCGLKTAVQIAGTTFMLLFTFSCAAQLQKTLVDILDHTYQQNQPDTTLAFKDKIMQPFFTTKPTGEGQD